MRTIMQRAGLLFLASMCLIPGLALETIAMSDGVMPEEVFHPQIREASGDVMVKSEKFAIWESAEAGMLLLAGDVLSTGKDGYAVIEFPSGKLEMYETTVVIIPSIGQADRKKDISEVVVDKGKTLFDINPLGVEKGFRFKTRNVQGGVKGTVFSVSYIGEGTTVNVYRGTVQVSDLQWSNDKRMNLGAGESLRVENDEDFRTIKEFDPAPSLEDYQDNIPPGLDGKGFPSDSNANPDNKGVRDRGEGHGRLTAPGQNR